MKKYIILYIESKWHSLNIDDFTDYSVDDTTIFKKENTLITFQSSDLIRHVIKLKIKILPSIIDLECFDKQMSQEGKEFRNHDDWKLITFLKHHKVIDSQFEFKITNFRLLLEHVAALYSSLLNKDESERDRFLNVELNINRIVYQRQFKGTKVDLLIAQKKCAELEREIYKLKNILQLEYNIFSPENEKQQEAYLKSNKFKIIQSLEYSFKVRRNDDRVCELLYNIIRNQKDLDSYLYILSHWGGIERTFPTFLGFGTITSRITMRQPSLQNLRRSNRSVIVPDTGMKFLYIDYSQFEAGILASLSQDELLIRLYNSDIYSDLAEKVLKNKDKRDDAKIVFYRYMYGDDSLDEGSRAYFARFRKLNEFIQKVTNLITLEKKIGTANGNYRHSMNNENSWSLSHIVQGTASLIYKKALIQTDAKVKLAEFLIPMHDGTLYQIPEYAYERCAEQIRNIYISEFKAMCPQIEPRVSCCETF